MLRTTKNMKDKYKKIQNYLFALIPEKWTEIYLYASVISGFGDVQNGEMYFYYIPKGILKKRPVNVYEVPKRFNISEEQYLKFVEELYNCIKDLKQDFADTDQELWTSVTISIKNYKFKVEYNYDNLPTSEEENNARHVIWRYKYLKIGGEKKAEQKILDDYFSHRKRVKRETYETGLYIKTENPENTSIIFNKIELNNPREVVVYEREDDIRNLDYNIQNKEENTEDEENIEIEYETIDEMEIKREKPKKKNQILNM